MIGKLKRQKRQRYRSMFFMVKSYCFIVARYKKAKRKKRNYRKDTEEYRKQGYTVFSMPTIISLYESEYRIEIISVIKSIHLAAENNVRKIKLIFSKTKKIYSSAMLLLFSELNNIINLYEDLILSCEKPSDEKSSHVLHQIGLYKICNYSFSPTKNYQDVIHWRECQGKGVIGEKYDAIVSGRDVSNSEIDLYGGCVEATKNAGRHAYIEKRDLSDVANDICEWWMFSQIKDEKLTVSICDLGVSIPKTLPTTRRKLFASIMKEVINCYDAEVIAGAIDGPASRSKKIFRGNGLPKIASIARETEGAFLEVFSRHGYVKLNSKGQIKKNFDCPIPGTIISWQLPIEERVV